MKARVLFLLIGALAGCNNLDVCDSTVEPLVQEDAQPYRCIAPEDCPRSSREFVCVTDVTAEQACVSCVDTRCVRIVPEPCS